MLIWNERRRLQREKRDSQDPGLSAAREAARPRRGKRPPVVENQQSSLTETIKKAASKAISSTTF
ncbi:MAG: hypothetical protein ACE3JN_01645 [Ectobacillus sp.]